VSRQLVWSIVAAFVFVGLFLVVVQPAFGRVAGPVYLSDGVTVYSPVNAAYNTKNILFNYTIGVGMGMHFSLNYTLDGTLTAPMPYTVINPKELHVFYLAQGQVQLPELSEGPHALTIMFSTDYILSSVHSSVDTIYFTVDSSAPDLVFDGTAPNITIQMPQTNSTYTNTVPLNVLLSEPTGQFTVTLDGERTLYLPAQNTTLPELTAGEHSISIQANDLAGNPGYSNYVKFTVEASSSMATSFDPSTAIPEFPWLLIVPLLLSVFSFAVLVRYRKAKSSLLE
jgi:hypothetical protein